MNRFKKAVKLLAIVLFVAMVCLPAITYSQAADDHPLTVKKQAQVPGQVQEQQVQEQQVQQEQQVPEQRQVHRQA